MKQSANADNPLGICLAMRLERNPKRKVRILIADHEGVFRFGLKRILDAEADLRVVAEAESSLEAIDRAGEFKADLVFAQAEIFSNGINNFVTRIRRASPDTRTVVTATHFAEGDGLRFTKIGAAGVILKSAPAELFVKCVRKVMENEIWLPKREVAQMARAFESTPGRMPRPAETLTSREKVIISYIVEGWRNREIAEHLSISEQTVKNHLRAIYDKIGVSDRLELALYAIHQRLELPPACLTPALH